jgi:hypothetical protein
VKQSEEQGWKPGSSVATMKPWESCTKSLEKVSDVQLPPKATRAEVSCSPTHSCGKLELIILHSFKAGLRSRPVPTASKPQSTEEDTENQSRKVSDSTTTPKTPPEMSKKQSATLRKRKAPMISPPGMETTLETEDQDMEGSSGLRRSLHNCEKHISSTSAVRMKIRWSPDSKQGKGEKPASSSKRSVEMTEEVQDWEMTSEAPTRVELEDLDEIMDVTDVNTASVHNSFALLPAKHSLFKSIGMGPPRGQSTPTNLSSGTQKHQKSEALGKSPNPISQGYADTNFKGPCVACKPVSY